MFQPPSPRMGLWTPGPPEFKLYWPGPCHLSGFITARKRSLRRLCFYTCLSVILFTGGSRPRPGGVWGVYAQTQGGSWGAWSGRVSRPRPRGRLGGVQAQTQGGGWGVWLGGVYAQTEGEVGGSGRGVSRPTPGGSRSRPRGCVSRPRGCIPACTEADTPPPHSRRPLLRTVRILLECILVENLFTRQVGTQCCYFWRCIWSGRPKFHLSSGPPEMIFHGHRWDSHFQNLMTYLPSRRLWLLRTTPLPDKYRKAKNWEHLWHPVWHECTVLPTRDISQLKQCYPIVQGSKTTIKNFDLIGNKSKSARSWKVQKGVTHAWNRASSLTHHNYLVLVTE